MNTAMTSGVGIEKNGHLDSNHLESNARTPGGTKRSHDPTATGLVKNPHAALLSQWLQRSVGSKILGICGVQQADGSSSVALDLAVSGAKLLELRVLLIDGNLYRPALHRWFRQKRGPGFAEIVTGQLGVADVVRKSQVERLDVLTIGSVEQTRWSDFDFSNLQNLWKDIRSGYDLVIVDLPSVAEMTSGINVSTALDGVLLVLRAEKTNMRDALMAKKHLENVDANIVGVVLNQQRRYLPEWLDRRL